MKKSWLKRSACLLVALSLCVGLIPAAAVELEEDLPAAETAEMTAEGAIDPPAAPARVWWDDSTPGFLKWDALEDVEGYVVFVYRDGTLFHEHYTWTSPYDTFATYYYALAFEDIPWTDGTYTAEVAAFVRDENHRKILGSKTLSDEFLYTKPDAQMDT